MRTLKLVPQYRNFHIYVHKRKRTYDWQNFWTIYRYCTTSKCFCKLFSFDVSRCYTQINVVLTSNQIPFLFFFCSFFPSPSFSDFMTLSPVLFVWLPFVLYHFGSFYVFYPCFSFKQFPQCMVHIWFKCCT